MTSPSATQPAALPKATLGETLGFAADVVIPTFAKGVIIRRPPMVALAERWKLDRRAVRFMQRLRNKYLSGPLLLRLPRRFPYALVLSPQHVQRVLNDTPEPFATDSREKHSALAHFQPHGVLISRGAERADRRRFNEAVLDAPHPVHRLAGRFVPIVDQEAAQLLGVVRSRGELVWDDFFTAWYRMVRRIMFGDSARDDHELTDLLARLRRDANWAFFKPRRPRLRADFYRRPALTAHARCRPRSTTSAYASS